MGPEGDVGSVDWSLEVARLEDKPIPVSFDCGIRVDEGGLKDKNLNEYLRVEINNKKNRFLLQTIVKLPNLLS